MAELNGSKIPISLQIGDKVIDGAVVKPLFFLPFVGFITEAYAMKQPASFDAKLLRVRMSKQVNYYTNGTVVPVSMEEALRLSIPDMHKIMARLDDDDGKVGKIIRDGDGITQAITYELANPLSLGVGKEPIRELEFFAKTYGDIEDVLSGDNDLHKTAKMIETIAKPVGHTSLLALPSNVVSQITANDGVALSRDVLPRFIKSPAE